MVNRNDAPGDILLEKVIVYLRQQAVPDFPDPEIAAFEDAAMNASSVPSISPLRRLAMNRRFRFSAVAMVGAAALLGLLLLWGGITAKPVSAMEKMAEEIRKAKSYAYTGTEQRLYISRPSQARPLTRTTVMTGYCLASGSYRSEVQTEVGPGMGASPKTTVSPAGKPGIEIDNWSKTFRRLPVSRREDGTSAMDDVEYLANFVGKADRELGIKEINGKKARGFEIDAKKIYPNSPPGVVEEIWLDAESNLPVRTHSETKERVGDVPARTVTLDMQWNIDLDPKLFDPTPPDGYIDTTPKPPSMDENIRQITEALKVYAEVSGGHYPPVNDVNIMKIQKMIGIGDGPTEEHLRSEKARNEFAENLRKCRRAVEGLRALAKLPANNPDFAYYRMTVGPNDKDKVLLRWKLDDGRYEVIFGDLRSETVTAERLRALEGK